MLLLSHWTPYLLMLGLWRLEKQKRKSEPSSWAQAETQVALPQRLEHLGE